ncbi:luxR-family transcriptional regulator [Streptomyces viridochromogenes DSM 40736]|uniref:LuxR-family transcriptional regulator n=1 Tax=Streptomyces viridochromogenes (strain DSM 40736 / JCM 4977 / BCRC 1201 / Tue 494) TaxID=591159 RepID=D9X6S3_STRVT|nr:luxR-family transcriptional regulator [Streptomyces viridochromogenes DSM 40736]
MRHGALRDPGRAAAELGLAERELSIALDDLSRLGLVHRAGEDEVWTPVDPTVAEVTARAPLEREIRERQLELSRLHARLRPVAALYAEHSRSERRAERLRQVDSAADVRRELSAMTRMCTEEMVSIQPGGGRNPNTLHGIVEESVAMLERGVRVRTLYQHTARASLATQTYVRAVSAAGARIRTTAEVFDRVIIFDRETAFVPQSRVEGRPQGASIVTDPTVVGFLYRMFETLWRSGRPFDLDEVIAGRLTEQDESAQDRLAADDLRLAILRLMAAGLKDDVIARRLGMAPRTLRRHLRDITGELRAESRFQAGYRAWRLGLPLEDEAGEPEPADGTLPEPE